MGIESFIICSTSFPNPRNDLFLNWSRRGKLPKSFKQNLKIAVDKPVADVVDFKAKPEFEMLRENDGFDYRSKTHRRVGESEVYYSGRGKMVIRNRGKGCRGEIVLTTEKDIERLMGYDEKDFEWCVKNLIPEKRNILRGYRRDLHLMDAT